MALGCFENKEEDAQTGFNFEASKYNWAKEREEKKEEEKVNQNKDDEDSSSFLRMIMD